MLSKILTEHEGQKLMIFSSTKKGCDELVWRLKQTGINALAIHGDKKQDERDWVLRQFKEGSCNVLVATDVAARGIDVKNVMCVVNFDLPGNVEDYVHRIGRTGRAGAYGTAHAFFTNDNGKMARELVDILREAGQQIPEELERMGSRGGYSSGGKGRGGKGKGKGRGGYGGGYGGQS